jgi:hypothetical protein
MRKESFEAAQEKIKNYLYTDDLKAYTTFDITNIFEKKREEWRIAGYRRANQFITFLDDSKILKLIKLKHQTTSTIKKILVEPNSSLHNIALTIKKDGYLSNYSAMQIHQLTLQIPKSIYVSYAKTAEVSHQDIDLKQELIDNAFSKPQRVTSEVYKSETDNTRFYFIQKAYTGNNVGIIGEKGYLYTDLERTLIDIAIRPAYSGGVFEVLEAFEIAKNQIDVNRLNNYLIELNYIYPYHQLLGFYMEKAGYDNESISIFLSRVSNSDMYLTYNISNKEYNEKWKLFYPKGF